MTREEGRKIANLIMGNIEVLDTCLPLETAAEHLLLVIATQLMRIATALENDS